MIIGDYVRTINGKIWIIKSQQAISGHKKDIIKSSPNIIDLIESDDYVNGYKVLNVIKFNDNSKVLSLDKIYNNKITNHEIKSIVTKEQFESMEYRIGE